MNSTAWTASAEVLLDWQVLRRLDDRQEDAITIAPALNTDTEAVGRSLQRLEGSGYAQCRELSAEEVVPSSAFITGHGQLTVSDWRTATAGKRRRACRAAMLDWLGELDEEYVKNTDQLTFDVRGHYYGEPFDEQTLHRAARELNEMGMIEGLRGDDMIMRPELTALGRTVVDQHDSDVDAWQASTQTGGTHFTATITGSPGANLSAASPGSQQVSHVMIQQQAQEALDRLARALEQAVPVLHNTIEGEDARLVDAVAELREVSTRVAEEPGRAARAVTAVKELMIGASAGALGSEVFAPMCDQLLDLLHRLT